MFWKAFFWGWGCIMGEDLEKRFLETQLLRDFFFSSTDFEGILINVS